MLDVLCPMHLVVRNDGRIVHVGPTVQKLRPDMTWIGAHFFEHFDVKRPKSVQSITDMRRKVGTKIHLALRGDPSSDLKAVLVPRSDGADDVVINLSFGISILDGVRTYGLSNADFAATDLAIEMLYLIEAKSAAMDSSRQLNLKLQGAKIAAEEQAFTDTLTGLKNRRAMDHVLARLVSRKLGFAVMQIDLDYFKAVNDTLGHAAGDHVLQAVAQIMVEETRAADTIARVGGDEFTLILPEIEAQQTLLNVGERLIERLEKPILFQGKECRISASIGTVWIRENQNVVPKDILSDADIALYQSKNAGRARQTIFDGRRRPLVS
ncbi:GGDEF domain-containing protein [Roseobacter sp. GAI101]|uniref:GGDEF domain-containing protein n=1 Tax=Roseobacter sp. (strain GAI101) TaxID=391589 RepID=UPI0020C7E770|nr:GGDEF domain-containing protein [Roseobacter sp. GAI101]